MLAELQLAAPFFPPPILEDLSFVENSDSVARFCPAENLLATVEGLSSSDKIWQPSALGTSTALFSPLTVEHDNRGAEGEHLELKAWHSATSP